MNQGNKRVMSDIYRQRKKVCVGKGSDSAASYGSVSSVGSASGSGSSSQNGSHWPYLGSASSASDESSDGPLNEVRHALNYFRSLFPVEKFDGRLPAIIVKHHLYSLVHNKTQVDKDIDEMWRKGVVRVFNLGLEQNDLCLVFTEDYKKHVKRLHPDKPVVDKFLSVMVSGSFSDLSVSRDSLLRDFQIRDDEITELIKSGLLTVRDMGTWWLAIPSVGEFMKSYSRGRKALLFMIRRSKYSEALQSELERRKLPKIAKLGMAFHIHDLIGADLVLSTNTTSGKLLSLKE